MNIGAVISRLRTQATSFETRIFGAAEFAAADENRTGITRPTAWVIPRNEEAEAATVREEFGVIVAVDNSRDAQGRQAAADLDALRDELLAALIGWSPTAKHRGVVYESASLGGADGELLMFQYVFSSLLERTGFITYTVDLVVRLKPASTPGTVLTELAAAVVAAMTGTPTRLASDYRGDVLAGLAAGATVFQLKGLAGGGEFDSNDFRETMPVVLTVYHRLGAAEAERDYTEGTMQTDAAALIDKSIWRTASVDQVAEAPAIEFPGDVTRD